MHLPYSIIQVDGERRVKISDPPQLLDCQELWNWMMEVRDDDPDLYAYLVTVYFQLRKPNEIK